MGSNLSVKVTADVTDAQTKFATMKAETAALASEFNKLARASVGGGLDSTAQQRYQQLAGDVSAARSKLAEMSAQMKSAKDGSGDLGQALEGLHTKLSQAFAATGLAIAAEGVMKLGEAITQLGDRAIEIRSMSEVLGVTTDQFQAMAVAGEEAGVSSQVFARASERLTNLLTEARNGAGKAVEQLHALGITTADIANPTFELNDALAVLKQRLEDSNSAEQTRKALLQDLGAKTALAIEAIKEYDGSQAGVAAAMAKVNGLSGEQIESLKQAKTWWSEVGTAISNTIAKVGIFATESQKMLAFKNEGGTPAPQQFGGSVTGTIDRSGTPTADQQAAAESARQQEALHNQVLQSEMASIKEGVSAFAAGTAERLAALRQYAALAKQLYGGNDVDEVRKANQEVLVAEREYRTTQGGEALADARTQAQALEANTSQTLAQRLDAEREIWSGVLANDKLNNAQRLQAAREFASEYTSIAKQTAAQASTITRQDISADIAISRMKIEAEKSNLQLGTAANAQAVAERLSQLRALTATEFSLNEQALQSELTTLNSETPAYNAVYNQIRELKQKLVLDLQALDRQAAEASKKYTKEQAAEWHGVVAEIEGAEGGMVNDLLTKRKSLSQSIEQMGAQLVEKEIANDLRAFTTKVLLSNQEKALEQGGFLYHLLFQTKKTLSTVQAQGAQTSAVTAGQAAQNTALISGTAAGKAVQAASGPSQVMADAAEAFAGAYAATAAIPYIGPELAPAAAAEAFAAVSSMAGAASLDVGTNYVPRDMYARIHEGEAVVPKEFNPAAGGGSEDGGGGGYQEQHNYNGNVSLKALDMRGMRSLLKGARNRREIAQAARQFVNRGGGRG